MPDDKPIVPRAFQVQTDVLLEMKKNKWHFEQETNFEVKTSLAGFDRGKIYELASFWRYCARIN